MALRINLYHEVLRAKKQEQYDPLRLSMIGLIVITLGLAGSYVIESTKKSSVQGAYNAKNAEFDRLTPMAKQAKEKEDQLTKRLSLADKFRKRIEERFYWAPVFEQITSAVPANVQLTKLTGVVGQDAARKCDITVDGMAAGDEPRAIAEELRVALAERFVAKYKGATTAFKSLDEGPEKVNLNGRRLPTVLFSISVSFTTGTPEPANPQKQIAKKN